MAKIFEPSYSPEQIEAYRRIGVDPAKTLANSLKFEHAAGDDLVRVTWQGLAFITVEEANEILNLRREDT